MRRVDSAEFQKWLEMRSGIPSDVERVKVGCEQCGISESVCPFMRGHCYTCLGYLYGQFVKCQQIVMWLDMNLPLAARGEINDRASALVGLGHGYRLPRADESDEQFASYCKGYAER